MKKDIKTAFDIDIYRELLLENRDFEIFVDTGENGIIELDKHFVFEPKERSDGAVLYGNFETKPNLLSGFIAVFEGGYTRLHYPRKAASVFSASNIDTIYGTTYLEWKSAE